ncbi:MAG TPA: TadE/TadG family type IV pilus assembly protein [Stellaceae bacterium]|nr:TadE/TadG family type IV pilus assembly protein [Stellaceae bacterium]
MSRRLPIFAFSQARRLFRDASGATAVQFAFILPMFVVVIFGIIESGRVMWLQNALSFAVEGAARCAAIDTKNCGTAAQVKSWAASQSGATFPTSTFSLSTAACGKLVTANYGVNLLIPEVTPALTLTAQACHP